MFGSLTFLLFAVSSATETLEIDPKSPNYIVIASTESVLQKNYPKESVKLGEQGVVQFRIRTASNGDLGLCQVVGSSGYARLDMATCDLLIGKTLFKKVVRNGKVLRGERFGQINWILPSDALIPAATPPKSSPAEIAKAGEAFMCRYSQKTGSLVTRTKQCMRGADFAAMQRMYEAEIDRIRLQSSWNDTSG